MTMTMVIVMTMTCVYRFDSHFIEHRTKFMYVTRQQDMFASYAS